MQYYESFSATLDKHKGIIYILQFTVNKYRYLKWKVNFNADRNIIYGNTKHSSFFLA